MGLAGQVSGSLSGGLGFDTLTGADDSNLWTIDGTDAGNVDGSQFINIESLEGGAGDDAFVFALTGYISGGLAGRAGQDRVRGADKNNAWTLSGVGAGDLNGSGFSGIDRRWRRTLRCYLRRWRRRHAAGPGQ